MPNGAQALMQTLADAGITICFTNPGTSEMHFVAALDDEPRIRAVLTLFEGVHRWPPLLTTSAPPLMMSHSSVQV